MINANRVQEKDFITDFVTFCPQIQIQESFPISEIPTPLLGLDCSCPDHRNFLKIFIILTSRYHPPQPPPSPSYLNYVTKYSFFYSRRRLEMEPEQQQNFWRNVQCIVEKDVVRTDRSNPYFAGEDNPNIDVMK